MTIEIDDTKEVNITTLFRVFNTLFNWKLSNYDLNIIISLYEMNEELLIEIPDYSERMTYIFSQSGKNKIIHKLNTKYNTFMNSLTKLRATELISNNQLNKSFAFKTSNDIKLTLDFKNGSK